VHAGTEPLSRRGRLGDTVTHSIAIAIAITDAGAGRQRRTARGSHPATVHPATHAVALAIAVTITISITAGVRVAGAGGAITGSELARQDFPPHAG
jgi:hypothetical protein